MLPQPLSLQRLAALSRALELQALAAALIQKHDLRATVKQFIASEGAAAAVVAAVKARDREGVTRAVEEWAAVRAPVA